MADRRQRELLDAVPEIAGAAIALAREGHGALLVLERASDLQDVVDSGQPVGAVVSLNLLASIFTPTSYLHDGAAVIRGNRLTAAACVLPLSAQESFPRRGLRHRASRGLTESTDAVVVVVSEETGEIRIALHGLVEGPYPERASLEARLAQLVSEPRPEAEPGALRRPGRLWRWARAGVGTALEALETASALARRLVARFDERLRWETLRAAGRQALLREEDVQAGALLFASLELAVEIGDRGLVVASLQDLADLVLRARLRADAQGERALVSRALHITGRLDPGVLWAHGLRSGEGRYGASTREEPTSPS